MTVLEGAQALPDGTIDMGDMRLMLSPFAESGAALQSVQRWVGDPGALSPDQIQVTGQLIKAAKDAEGTKGTTENPATGKPMPKIAKRVSEIFEENGWLVSEEEKETRRQQNYEDRMEAKHSTEEYRKYLEQLREVSPNAANRIEAMPGV